MVCSHKGLDNSIWFNRFPPPKHSYTEAEDNSDIVFHCTIRWYNSRYNNHLSESEVLFLCPRVTSLHMLKNSMNENLCSWRVFLDFVLCRLFDITICWCVVNFICIVQLNDTLYFEKRNEWYIIITSKPQKFHEKYFKTYFEKGRKVKFSVYPYTINKNCV